MTRTGATLAGRLWVMRSLVTQYGPVAQCGSDQRSRSNPLFHCLPEFTIVPLLLIDARSMSVKCSPVRDITAGSEAGLIAVVQRL